MQAQQNGGLLLTAVLPARVGSQVFQAVEMQPNLAPDWSLPSNAVIGGRGDRIFGFLEVPDVVRLPAQPSVPPYLISAALARSPRVRRTF